MRGIFPGCCAVRHSHTTPRARQAMSDKPRQFSILDFQISDCRIEPTKELRIEMSLLHALISLNLKSAIENLKCHLMTLSARTSTFGGIVRPICLAAFRLMMNSNFIGCSTGRSAGLAPLRILST